MEKKPNIFRRALEILSIPFVLAVRLVQRLALGKEGAREADKAAEKMLEDQHIAENREITAKHFTEQMRTAVELHKEESIYKDIQKMAVSTCDIGTKNIFYRVDVEMKNGEKGSVYLNEKLAPTNAGVAPESVKNAVYLVRSNISAKTYVPPEGYRNDPTPAPEQPTEPTPEQPTELDPSTSPEQTGEPTLERTSAEPEIIPDDLGDLFDDVADSKSPNDCFTRPDVNPDLDQNAAEFVPDDTEGNMPETEPAKDPFWFHDAAPLYDEETESTIIKNAESYSGAETQEPEETPSAADLAGVELDDVGTYIEAESAYDENGVEKAPFDYSEISIPEEKEEIEIPTDLPDLFAILSNSDNDESSKTKNTKSEPKETESFKISSEVKDNVITIEYSDNELRKITATQNIGDLTYAIKEEAHATDHENENVLILLESEFEKHNPHRWFIEDNGDFAAELKKKMLTDMEHNTFIYGKTIFDVDRSKNYFYASNIQWNPETRPEGFSSRTVSEENILMAHAECALYNAPLDLKTPIHYQYYDKINQPETSFSVDQKGKADNCLSGYVENDSFVLTSDRVIAPQRLGKLCEIWHPEVLTKNMSSQEIADFAADKMNGKDEMCIVTCGLVISKTAGDNETISKYTVSTTDKTPKKFEYSTDTMDRNRVATKLEDLIHNTKYKQETQRDAHNKTRDDSEQEF